MKSLFESLSYKQIMDVLNVFGTGFDPLPINNYAIDVVRFEYNQDNTFLVSLGNKKFGPRYEHFNWVVPAKGYNESFDVEV